MQSVVFLPATVPGDPTYGTPSERLPAFPDLAICQVRYPRQVWYNAEVRREAVAQIRRLAAPRVILVGFSKSGLGAWNLARTIPELVAGTIIFDAPVARDILPPWDTAAFYRDDADWQQDLPLRTLPQFAAAVSPAHGLVLISGANFHDEMRALAQALAGTAVRHVFLPRPDLPHHWQSGWIEAGIAALAALRD